MKPSKRKRAGRVQWGVVLSKCVNKNDAQWALAHLLTLDPEFVIYKPVVRRLTATGAKK